MNDTTTGLPVTTWTAGHNDSTGERWMFDYVAGRSNIKIRPFGTVTWTHQIQLIDHGMQPGDVTDTWLAEQAAAWIEQYNEDIAAGNV